VTCRRRPLMASSCLRRFQAVEDRRRALLDGGYMGNPSLFPLIYGADSAMFILVQINR